MPRTRSPLKDTAAFTQTKEQQTEEIQKIRKYGCTFPDKKVLTAS